MKGLIKIVVKCVPCGFFSLLLLHMVVSMETSWTVCQSFGQVKTGESVVSIVRAGDVRTVFYYV